MRLRLTVKRHKLEDTSVVWAIDTSSNPIIFNLLQQVNDIIPIESDDKWGLEDYAVEVKGSTGVNYECLHFQHVKDVLKDEDEVIIRPLLSQDIHIRSVSGRVQISTAGRRLVDGVPLGKPLLRKAKDRPAINIPPRKRARIDYDRDDEEGEDDEDTAGVQALKDRDAEDSEDDGNRQLVLHADFEDEDSEEDEDFAPGDDEDEDMEEEDDEEIEEDHEEDDEEPEDEEEAPPEPRQSGEETDNADEAALADVNDEATRAQIRKLKSAFPKAPLAVCKYVLDGSEDKDVGEAYEAMARGFIPVLSKSAITESAQGVNERKIAVPKTRSKWKTPSVQQENVDRMLVEPDESQNAIISHYDQNGLPEGSIKSGKALKFMAEALQSSPARPRSEARRSASIASTKSVRFAETGSLSNGLTSTPFIDKESQVEDDGEESEEQSNEDSEESSDEEATSNEDSSDSSSDNAENGKGDGGDTASSDSDSDSNDSSSDDESPEEASSKQTAATPPRLNNPPPSQETSGNQTAAAPPRLDNNPTPAQKTSTKQMSTAPPKLDSTPPRQNKQSTSAPISPPTLGTRSTKRRNERRRNANALNRFKEKGILPAGTTLAEFSKLQVDAETSPAAASAALENLRGAKEEPRSQQMELAAARAKLLADLASGGIDVDARFESLQSSPAVGLAPEVEMTRTDSSANEAVVSQERGGSHQVTESQNAEIQQAIASSQSDEPQETVASPAAGSEEVAFSAPLDHTEPILNHTESSEQAVEMAGPSTAPPAAVENPPESQNPPASLESSQPSPSRRPQFSFGGAAKRTLFGALGMKTPKTKEDEEKIRKDLMKGIRPLIPSKATEQADSAAADEAADEDLEAWREKINYRAVECLQDGIVLSEPPFPFVQRWDPQQQSSWSQKGNRGGKRKQDQRNQSIYQDDTRASKKQKRRKGKHTYAEEQEYFEASYEPSHQDDTMTSQFDDSMQSERRQSDDVEGDITQQLMNDLQNSATGFSQPEDLASLPEDLSSLEDLQDGQAKVGMTIAFKRLEMSESTNWQPQISAYRTAIIFAIAENGNLQLTLAMRDRAQPTKRYDEETGERIYAKFEMADVDDMDEDNDDGTLNLSLGELIEAKIVRPADANDDVNVEEESQAKPFTSFDTVTLSNEGAATSAPADATVEEEAQFSHVTETSLNSDAIESHQPDDAMGDAPAESVDSVPPVDNSVGEVNTPIAEEQEFHPVAPENLAELEPISEESRKEYDHLIKEGGFRSSVASSVTRVVRPDGMASPAEAAAFEKLQQDFLKTPINRSYSPKFNGLGSSPTREPRDASKSPKVATHEVSPQVPFQSSWETYDGPTSSPPGVTEKSPEPSTPTLPPPASGWETVDESLSSPPEAAQHPPEVPALPAASVPTTALSQAESGRKLLSRQLPISKAQQMWQAMQPRKRSPTPGPDADSSIPSPAPQLGLDGADERDVVEYPKLSIGSSFTSQVADAGRQPDFNFEGSVDLSAGTPKGPTPDAFSHDQEEELQLEGTRSAARKAATEDALSDSEPELPFTRPINKPTAVQRPDILEDDISSDELPIIDQLVIFHSQRSTTREKAPSKPAGNKNAGPKETAEGSGQDDLDSDFLGEDQTTPKASQNRRSVSANRPAKRNLEKSASLSRASGPRSSQPRPSQSQPKPTQESVMIDLTMSSDVEPESPVRQKDSPSPRKFKAYDIDDDDDEEPGWRPKKNSSLRGVEARRQTRVGLKPSSQTSLNQNRRKTKAR